MIESGAALPGPDLEPPDSLEGSATLPAGLPQDPDGLAAVLLAALAQRADPANVAGMARYGISTAGTLGVPMPVLRGYVRELRPLRRANPESAHAVAARLWASGGHEARILAGLLEVPALVTRAQADAWVAEIDSWDLCDQLSGLFAATAFADDLITDWTAAEAVFSKRCGFVLICAISVHDKRRSDADLVEMLALIEREAGDDRNFVKRAVNWALRQVGKRSPQCHAAAVDCAEKILRTQPGSASARWIARDALRELNSDAVLARLAKQGGIQPEGANNCATSSEAGSARPLS